jgi:hypothetical protein
MEARNSRSLITANYCLQIDGLVKEYGLEIYSDHKYSPLLCRLIKPDTIWVDEEETIALFIPYLSGKKECRIRTRKSELTKVVTLEDYPVLFLTQGQGFQAVAGSIDLQVNRYDIQNTMATEKTGE